MAMIRLYESRGYSRPQCLSGVYPKATVVCGVSVLFHGIRVALLEHVSGRLLGMFGALRTPEHRLALRLVLVLAAAGITVNNFRQFVRERRERGRS